MQKSIPNGIKDHRLRDRQVLVHDPVVGVRVSVGDTQNEDKKNSKKRDYNKDILSTLKTLKIYKVYLQMPRKRL